MDNHKRAEPNWDKKQPLIWTATKERSQIGSNKNAFYMDNHKRAEAISIDKQKLFIRTTTKERSKFLSIPKQNHQFQHVFWKFGF